MKIGYLTTPLGQAGGWALYARGVIESVSQLPDTTVIVLAGSHNIFLPQHITLIPVLEDHITYSFKDQCKVFFQCMKYLKGCDVVHLTFEKPMIGAALACRILGATLVMTLHGTYSVPPSGRSFKDVMKRSFMRFAYKTAAITTTGSFNTEDRVREIIPELPECRFIPNGVDSRVFKKDPTVATGNYVLSVGWLKPRKGFDTMIEALQLLKDEFPHLRYKIIGGDTDTEDSDYYRLLQKLISDSSLEERVEIRLGKISREDLAKEYNACKVFVLTSRDSGGHFEGFPMVYMEAFACGAPVVTTRGYGSEYAIQEGKNGYLVTQENPQETADAIRQIITNEDVYQSMKESALQRAAEHFWSVIAPQIMILYKDGLKRNQRLVK